MTVFGACMTTVVRDGLQNGVKTHAGSSDITEKPTNRHKFHNTWYLGHIHRWTKFGLTKVYPKKSVLYRQACLHASYISDYT